VPLRALRGDLTAPVAGEQFDVVVSNPPYVPAATDVLPQHGPLRAFDGGRDGRTPLDRVFDEAPAVLAPGGQLLAVHSELWCVGRHGGQPGEEDGVRRMRLTAPPTPSVSRPDNAPGVVRVLSRGPNPFVPCKENHG